MIRTSRLFTIILILFCSPIFSQNVEKAEKLPPNSHMKLGPVAGLTTQWQVAPPRTMIPLGTTVQFSRFFSNGEIIAWHGATEVFNDGQRSVAEVHLDTLGRRVVFSELLGIRGERYSREISRLNVVDVYPRDIIVSAVRASVEPVVLNQYDLNASTYEYFTGGSIAALTELGEDRYATSINREVELEVDVEPVGFAPLVEWRRSLGDPLYGKSVRVEYWQPGIDEISVGPAANPPKVLLEVYRVEISSHVSSEDAIPTGEPVTFTAVTYPLGYEEYVSWLGSTKFGSCEPVLGEGGSFTAYFEDTWGPHPTTNELFQWMGIKADSQTFSQDCGIGELCATLGFDRSPRCRAIVKSVVTVTADEECPVTEDDFICVYCSERRGCPISKDNQLMRLFRDIRGRMPLCSITIEREFDCSLGCRGTKVDMVR